MSQRVNLIKLHDFIWVPLIEATVVAILAITSKNSADPFSLGNSLITRIAFSTSEEKSLKARIHYSKSSRKDKIYNPKSTKHLVDDGEFVNRCRCLIYAAPDLKTF